MRKNIVKITHIWIALLVLLSCVVSMPSAALAEGEAQSCASEAELRALIQNGANDINLAGNIVWSSNSLLRIATPTSVYMGDYSITVLAGSSIQVAGEDASFIGNGNVQPLFILQDHEINVQAAGGLNGITIRTTADGAMAVYGTLDVQLNGCTVTADGANATAVHAERGIALSATSIAAKGSGSTGASCHGAASVVSESVVLGSAASAAAASVAVDYAYLDPLPERASYTLYRASVWEDCASQPDNFDILRYGLTVAEGAVLSLPNGLFVHCYKRDPSAPGEAQSRSEFIDVAWSGMDALNTGVLGTYKLHAAPDVPQYMRMTTDGQTPVIEGLEPRDIAVRVVGANEPYLAYAAVTRDFWMGTTSVSLCFFTPIEDAQDIRVFRSEDKGATWADITDVEDTMIAPDAISVGELEEEKLYLFKAEINGGAFAGMTNTVSYWHSPTGDPGGDVDGGDQGDQGELPPETPPHGDGGPNPPPADPGTDPQDPPAAPPVIPPPQNPPTNGAADVPLAAKVSAGERSTAGATPPDDAPVEVIPSGASFGDLNAQDKPSAEGDLPVTGGENESAAIAGVSGAPLDTAAQDHDRLLTAPAANPPIPAAAPVIIESLPPPDAHAQAFGAWPWLLGGAAALGGVAGLFGVSLTTFGARFAFLRRVSALLRHGS